MSDEKKTNGMNALTEWLLDDMMKKLSHECDLAKQRLNDLEMLNEFGDDEQ